MKPTKKDKIIVKDVALAVAEEIVSKVPGLNLAYGLSKALFGAGLKLRQKRVLEWVEMVRDNPSIFTQQILSDDTFQDGFAVALEKYLVERNEEKRRVFRNIFLGFAEAEDKEKFPLEKFSHTLSQLTEMDIEVLGDVEVEEYGQNYQIYGNSSDKIDNIHSLIGLNLLLNTTGTRGGYDPKNSPFVKLSPFGREFIKYLKE